MRRSKRPADWILDGQLMASPYPTGSEDFAELGRCGVTLCINLDKKPLQTEFLRQYGIRELHLPVRDFTAPSAVVLAQAVAAIGDALGEGGTVAINCGAGLGRTGTVVAAWLVSQGATAENAIAQVRERRPGSVETRRQERAVHKFADTVIRSRS